jgi:HEAT repeat protein
VVVTAHGGEVAWRVGDRRGSLRAGESVRLGPEGSAESARVEDPLGPIDRPLGPIPEHDRELVRSSDPVDVLIRDLSGRAPPTRIAAAERLARLCGGPRVARALAARLVEERDPRVCRALLQALRRLDAREHHEAVRPLLREPQVEVREAALLCWIELRGEEGVPEIGRFVDDPEPWLRVLALRGLRALADPAARPWAVKALEDPEPEVRAEAEAVLEAIGS